MIFFPKTKLAEVAQELGGLSRDMAIESATNELETMRDEADLVFQRGITAIEEMAAAPETAQGFSYIQMNDLLTRGDQIVTLSGTFGHQGLDKATRGLCDLLLGLLQTSASDVPSVRVHVRAMRLLAPGSPALPEMHQQVILAELSKILVHHGFTPASEAPIPAGPEAGKTNP
jgi:hypothetical protein